MSLNERSQPGTWKIQNESYAAASGQRGLNAEVARVELSDQPSDDHDGRQRTTGGYVRTGSPLGAAGQLERGQEEGADVTRPEPAGAGLVYCGAPVFQVGAASARARREASGYCGRDRSGTGKGSGG